MHVHVVRKFWSDLVFIVFIVDMKAKAVLLHIHVFHLYTTQL